VATAAFAVPANANLVGSAADGTGFPASFTATNPAGEQSFLCLAPALPCGLDALTAQEIAQPGGEGFYWSGAVSVPMPQGAINVTFDVEAATDEVGVQSTFQRVQVGGDAGLPNGTYVITSPFGPPMTVTKTAGSPANRWARFESADASIGPIDHYLTTQAAPAGFFGDSGVDPGPVVGDGTVKIERAGTSEIGTTADWTIVGRRDAAAPVVPGPPADADGDGVPNAADQCPSTPGSAANGCAGATPGAAAGAAAAGGAVTIVQFVPGQGVLGTQASALRVSNLSLARRISRARLRAQGLRLSMRVPQGTNTLRIAVYKARNGQRTGSALLRTSRTPRAGLYRVTLRNRSLLRKLRAGSYVVEVRAGRSAASLGTVRRIGFTVTR